MDRDPLCHMADGDCLSLGDSSPLTPIDRLYSMQDSYFTSWGWLSDSDRLNLSQKCGNLVRGRKMLEGDRGTLTVIPCNTIPCSPLYKPNYTPASYALKSLRSLLYVHDTELSLCLNASTHVNSWLGVYLYLFSKCVCMLFTSIELTIIRK